MVDGRCDTSNNMPLLERRPGDDAVDPVVERGVSSTEYLDAELFDGDASCGNLPCDPDLRIGVLFSDDDNTDEMQSLMLLLF